MDTTSVCLGFFFVNSQVSSLQSKEVVVYCVCLCVFQAAEEGGETVACYSVCVSLVEGEETANSRWSVQRKLTEFQMLHRKLTEVTWHQSCTQTCQLLLLRCLNASCLLHNKPVRSAAPCVALKWKDS